MTPIELLDAVLFEMAMNPGLMSPDASDGEIGKVMTEEYPEIKHDRIYSDINRILNKLRNEGYIDSHLRPFDKKEGVRQIAHYFITFDGELFNSKGGYKAKELNTSIALKKTQSDVEEQQRLSALSVSHANRLNRLTGTLAVGTIALAVLEVLKLFLNHYSSEYGSFWVALVLFLFGIIAGIIIYMLTLEGLSRKRKD